MTESATGERRRRRGITRVTDSAIARRRHVVLDFPGCSRPIMTGRTGQSFVCPCQGRVVEARDKTTAGLMALLAQVRRPRVVRTFADGSRRIAYHMTGYARLSLDRRVLVVDRIDFLEFASRRVTSVAVPALRIGGGVCRTEWGSLARGLVGRIIVGTNVARTATGRESRM